MLTVHYRGRLASCNYACSYCPFAKRRDTRTTLRTDALELQRFVDWASVQSMPMRVMFTPWGEALIRRHYQQALLSLAAMPHIAQVSAQTNLSGALAWLASAPRDKLSLWCTFHPSQTSIDRFVARCRALDNLGIRHSVGVVAMPAHYAAIRELRSALPARVPMWFNAYDRRRPGYYTAEDLRWLESIDPFFHHNHSPGHSRGAPCRAGEDAVMVDGDGTVQRCHFIPTSLGNLYTDDLSAMLKTRACSRFKCDCFVGYAQRKDLPFEAAFGNGLPARIPLHVA